MIGLLRIHRFLPLSSPKRWPNIWSSLTKNRKLSESTLDVNTNVAKDVILFKYDNPTYFKVMNIFAGCQFLFWSYLSVFAFTSLKDAPADQSKKASWWRKINLGEERYRYGLSIISFLIGYGILSVAWTYTLKSVRYLILHQGGQKLSFVTYTPFGKNRIITVNIKNINCKESRIAAKSQLPIKVKGHYLHYILDMKGQFKNPALFDHTAGLRRKWRTA